MTVISSRVLLCFFFAICTTAVAASQGTSTNLSNVLTPLGYNIPGGEFIGSGAAGIAKRGLSSTALNNPAGIGSTP